MLAASCLATARAPQHLVGFRRTVRRNYVDGFLAAEFAVDVINEVDQGRIDFRGFVLAPVAQEPVEFLESAGEETITALIGNAYRFLCVNIIERDCAVLISAEARRTGHDDSRTES